MKHLLDTHVLVWWLAGDKKLRREHAKILQRSEQAGTSVGISAISLWEIAKLVERGRVVLDQAVDEALSAVEANSFLHVVPVSARIAVESTRLGANFPSDPVDQLIAATARCLGLTLLTVDERIIKASVVSTS